MQIKIIALLVLIPLLISFLILSGYTSVKNISINLEPCPLVEEASNFTKIVFESVKNSSSFEIGKEVDLGFYKVLIKNIEIKKEYLDPFSNKLVKTECPNLIVDFEIEKIKLEESKEAFNPLFLSIGKEFPPRVDIFAIFEKNMHSCQVIEGQLGIEDNATVGTKVAGKCRIPFREDWGKERYLVIELYKVKTGGSLLIPIILINERETLKYYKTRF